MLEEDEAYAYSMIAVLAVRRIHRLLGDRCCGTEAYHLILEQCLCSPSFSMEIDDWSRRTT